MMVLSVLINLHVLRHLLHGVVPKFTPSVGKISLLTRKCRKVFIRLNLFIASVKNSILEVCKKPFISESDLNVEEPFRTYRKDQILSSRVQTRVVK